VLIFTIIIVYIKYLFIYLRFKLKLVKGQLLARDEIPLVTSSAPFSPILLPLKIIKEIIQKRNNYLKNNFKSKENIKIYKRKLNKLFSCGVSIHYNNCIHKIFIYLR
jgi:hypothetical protein